MKQPTPLWTVISICVTVFLASFAGITSTNTRIARLEEKVENQTIRSDDRDKTMSTMQLDIRQILIILQNKQDRKN